MKVVGVVCSPRRTGNTATLVEAVLSGAMKHGAETEIFYSGDLEVKPCRDCDSCDKTGECSQKDDMQLIYKSLEEANVVVFGTPIYHDHVSAQAKAVIDRLGAYEGPKKLPKGMKAVIIITYEWDNPKGYDYVVEWIKQTFKRYHRVETVATLKAYGTRTPVTQRPDLLKEAEDIGGRLLK